MTTVKITLIPVGQSEYFNKFLNETKCPKTYRDKYELIKKRHLKYVVEQLVDFEPRLEFKIKKGIIEFKTNKPSVDLRILFGHYIMDEVENIEIIRG